MRALIVINDLNPKASDAAASLKSYLESQKIDYNLLVTDVLRGNVLGYAEPTSEANKYDLAVALGGDGTIIRTARYLRKIDCPILGINFGHLGFLANNSEDGVINLVSQALAGELTLDRRTNICIRIICEDEKDDVNNIAHEYFALNEVSVSRGISGDMIHPSIDIGNTKIADLKGDGVIIASATGSTAYALAAGGPIVAPGFGGLIIQPLAPHTLTVRTVLTNSSDIVRLGFSRPDDRQSIKLFGDGDLIDLDSPIRCVYVMHGEKTTNLLYKDPDHFYSYTAKTFYGSGASN